LLVGKYPHSYSFTPASQQDGWGEEDKIKTVLTQVEVMTGRSPVTIMGKADSTWGKLI